MLDPSQIVELATEAVPATLTGSIVILLEKEDVHWLPSEMVKIGSKVPAVV